jgi:hypothetical protein
LVLAVACEAGMLAGFLYLRPLAIILGHAPPNAVSYVVALLAIPAVLVADALQKQYSSRRRTTLVRTRNGQPGHSTN